MNRAELENSLSRSGVEGRIWGRRGAHCRLEIEQALGAPLGTDLGEFVESVGNANIGSFSLIVAGSDDLALSAVMRTNEYGVSRLGALVVMDHAGEVYLYMTSDGAVIAYDEASIVPANQTLRFASFTEFVQWLVDQSR